jgi:cytochrome d ubiquinol oxidase subunit II
MMSYIALIIPFVLGYIIWVWRQMDSRKLSLMEVVSDKKSY